MITLLIIWVAASLVFCLAFLAAAARRTPRAGEELAAGALGQHQALVPSSSYPSPVLPEAPVLKPAPIPAIPAGLQKERRFAERPHWKRKREPMRRVALAEVTVGLVLGVLLLTMTGSLWLVGSRELAATREMSKQSPRNERIAVWAQKLAAARQTADLVISQSPTDAAPGNPPSQSMDENSDASARTVVCQNQELERN
jgi:hypothetical protein